MFYINDSTLAAIPTPFDAKLCNFYIEGSYIVIESIAEYLERVDEYIRIPEVTITMLMPKEGASFGTYPIEEFAVVSENFEGHQYAFVGGLTNENFIEVGSNQPEITEELIGDIDGVNQVFNTTKAYKPDTLQIYVNGLKEFFFSKTGDSEITFDFAPSNEVFTDKIEAIYKPI